VSALKVCPQCGTEYPANARFCEVDGTALRSAAGGEDLVGTIVADRYHVMKKLGEGGMGQVYLVEHVKMGRKSALKVMHPGMGKDVDAISRFNREAANASRINHPNVASVYDFGETTDGIIYLAMELVDGPPLTAVIEQLGALPAKRAAEIVRQTSEALGAACDLGIVHRDLKPDNIMIAKSRDGSDCVKVVDFGIAKAAGNDAQKVTKTGLVVGTPDYMSPEQLSGDKLDGRSDIYSLGLVAFNMLTGKLPFPSESAQESMIMRLTDEPKALGEMKPDVSWTPEVQAVMDKALQRDASLRYQTASEFGRALVQAVECMPATQAAEAGTQVIDTTALPATRVSQRPSAPHGDATVAMPTPEAVINKKSMAPVIGGIAAVLLVGALGMKMMGGKGAAAADTTKPAQQQVAPANNQAATRAVDSTSAPAAAAPAAGRAKPPIDLETIMSQLETDAGSGEAGATAVLTRLKALSQSVTNPDDKARINFIRFKAYTSKSDSLAACTSIKAAVQAANDPKLKAKYQDRADAC
jgi:hypothetical protein